MAHAAACNVASTTRPRYDEPKHAMLGVLPSCGPELASQGSAADLALAELLAIPSADRSMDFKVAARPLSTVAQCHSRCWTAASADSSFRVYKRADHSTSTKEHRGPHPGTAGRPDLQPAALPQPHPTILTEHQSWRNARSARNYVGMAWCSTNARNTRNTKQLLSISELYNPKAEKAGRLLLHMQLQSMKI